MHAIGLIEVATCFVQHTEAQISLRLPPPRDATHAFWLTCRYRHDAWSGRLAAHRSAIQRPGVSFRSQQWHEIVPIIQEILITEPLTRCVAYYATVLEELEIEGDFSALAHSALAAHVEARHRCLHLIVFGTGLPSELAARFNRLRRTCEAFTDQLLAAMRPVKNIDVFSFDSLDTSTARSKLLPSTALDSCHRLHSLSLSHWFVQRSALELDYRKASPVQNEQIAKTVIGLFPQRMFDSFGVPLTQRAAMLRSTCDDSCGKISSPLDLMKNVSSIREISTQSSNRRW